MRKNLFLICFIIAVFSIWFIQISLPVYAQQLTQFDAAQVKTKVNVVAPSPTTLTQTSPVTTTNPPTQGQVLGAKTEADSKKQKWLLVATLILLILSIGGIAKYYLKKKSSVLNK